MKTENLEKIITILGRTAADDVVPYKVWQDARAELWAIQRFEIPDATILDKHAEAPNGAIKAAYADGVLPPGYEVFYNPKESNWFAAIGNGTFRTTDDPGASVGRAWQHWVDSQKPKQPPTTKAPEKVHVGHLSISFESSGNGGLNKRAYFNVSRSALNLDTGTYYVSVDEEDACESEDTGE